MSDIKEFKYCSMYVKKHKKSNKRILFVVFNDGVIIDDIEIVNKMIHHFNKTIKTDAKMASIIDARGVIRCTKNIAFSTSDFMLQFKDLYVENLDKLSIILDKPMLILLLNSVTVIQPFVVPTEIVNNNKSAIDFVINKKV